MFTEGGGACPGACVPGGHACPGGVCAWVACMAGGVHGRGHVCPGGGGVMHAQGACVSRETATAAGGTHPTGMHSYFGYNS